MSQPGRSASEPAPGVEVPASVRVAAGSRSALEVVVTNTAREPRRHVVIVVGVDAAWVPGAVHSPVVAPGASTTVRVEITPPTGTLPAHYPLAVTVQAMLPGATDETDRQDAGPVGFGDCTVLVNPRADVSLRVDPDRTTLVRSRRVRVTLTNGGAVDVPIELEATTTKGLELRLRRRSVVVPAGTTTPVRVRGRLVATRPRRFGASVQHSWSLTASSPELARRARGSVRQRALLGPAWGKLVVGLTVLAVWAAAFLVFARPALQRIGDDDQQAPADSGQLAGDGVGPDGVSPDGVDGKAGSTIKLTRATSKDAPKGLQLNGSVTGDSPEGVLVSLRKTALSSADVQDAVPVGFTTGRSAGPGKVLSTSRLVAVPSRVVPDRTQTTTDDGSWQFLDVESPGYYVLTLSRPGYTTQKFLVDSTRIDPAQPIEAALVPAEGSISGQVRDADGTPLPGAATVTVSDGLNTLSTSTVDSDAGRGSFEVTGLSTPGSFVVEASLPGYGTQIRRVDLGAEDTRDGVDLGLVRGVGTLQGTLTVGVGDRAVGVPGLAVTVTAADGTVRTGTTESATTDAGTRSERAGRFRIPGLVPGSYVVSVSGDGWMPLTRVVTVGEGGVVGVFNEVVERSTGSVTGRVTLETAPDANSVALVSSTGLTLTNSSRTYKTTATSVDPGSYAFDEVVPGTYTLTATLGGFASGTRTVTVTAGDLAQTVNLTLVDDGGTGIPMTGRIAGSVEQAATGDVIDTCDVVPQCIEATVTATGNDTVLGDPVLIGPRDKFCLPAAEVCEATGSGLEVGSYDVTVRAPGFEERTISVQVPSEKVVTAPPVELVRSPYIRGTISAGAGTPGSPTCVVVLAASAKVAPGQDACTEQRACKGVGATTVTTLDPPADATYCARLDNGVGDYSVQVPRRGDYQVLVANADKAYQFVDLPVKVTAPVGGVAVHNVVIRRYGQVQVTALEAGGSGVLVGSEGSDVTLAPSPLVCNGAAVAEPLSQTCTTKSPAGGRLTFTGLDPDVEYTLSSSKGGVVSDPVKLTVGLDQTVDATQRVVERVPYTIVRATRNDVDARGPIAGARVSILAPTSYTGTSPVNSEVVLTSSTNGCVAVVRPAQSTGGPQPVLPDDEPCRRAGYGQDSRKEATFLSRTAAEVAITAPGYDSLLRRDVPLTAAVNEFSLDPSGVPFSGTIGVVGATAQDVSWDKVRLTLTSRTTTTGTVTLTVGAGGVLKWDDSRYTKVDVVRPGTYEVSASLEGYVDSPRQTLVCKVGDGPQGADDTCRLSGLVLKKLGALRITSAPTGATVTLRKGGARVGEPLAADTSGTATFAGLVPGETDYTVDVRAAGFAFADSAPLTCAGAVPVDKPTITSGVTTSCSVTLTQLAGIKGTVSTIEARPTDTAAADTARTARPDLLVAVQRCKTGETEMSQDNPLTTTFNESFRYCKVLDPTSPRLTTVTDGLGKFSFSGTTEVEAFKTGFWVISTAEVSGFAVVRPRGAAAGTPTGVTVEVPTVADGQPVVDVVQPVDLYLSTARYAVTVLDQYGVRLKDGEPKVKVELLQDDASVDSAEVDGTATTATYVFADAFPGVYTLRVSGTGLVTSTIGVEVRRNVAQQSFQYYVTRVANRFRGRVSGNDVASPGYLAGATVSLRTCTGTDAASCTATEAATGTDGEPVSTKTKSDGTFDFTNVPDGNLQVRVERDDYEPLPLGTPIKFDHLLPSVPEATVTLAAVRRVVRAPVTVSNSAQNLGGGKVTLTAVPADATNPTQTTTLANTSGNQTAEWTGIRPGCYKLEITLPADQRGNVTYPDSETCGTGTATGNVLVPRTSQQTDALVRGVSVSSSELKLSVTATAQAEHAAPTTTSLKVVGSGDLPDLTFPSFPIAGTTTSRWLPPGRYDVDSALQGAFSSVFWPTASGGADLAAGTSSTVALTHSEKRASLAVTVVGTTTATEATVTVVAGVGNQIPSDRATYGTPGVKTVDGKVSLDLPSGSWTITATSATGQTATKTITISTLAPTLVLTPPPPPAPTPDPTTTAPTSPPSTTPPSTTPPSTSPPSTTPTTSPPSTTPTTAASPTASPTS